MPIPTHADRHASEELSEVLESILADANEEPVTLGMARERMKEALAEQGREAIPSTGSERSLYAELESLVEEYGEDAPARDFMVMKASGQLADLIESILDQTEGEEGVTIGRVREAVREGLLDPDAEQALIGELDALIERYGEDKPAEDLLPFE